MSTWQHNNGYFHPYRYPPPAPPYAHNTGLWGAKWSLPLMPTPPCIANYAVWSKFLQYPIPIRSSTEISRNYNTRRPRILTSVNQGNGPLVSVTPENVPEVKCTNAITDPSLVKHLVNNVEKCENKPENKSETNNKLLKPNENEKSVSKELEENATETYPVSKCEIIDDSRDKNAETNIKSSLSESEKPENSSDKKPKSYFSSTVSKFDKNEDSRDKDAKINIKSTVSETEKSNHYDRGTKVTTSSTENFSLPSTKKVKEERAEVIEEGEEVVKSEEFWEDEDLDNGNNFITESVAKMGTNVDSKLNVRKDLWSKTNVWKNNNNSNNNVECKTSVGNHTATKCSDRKDFELKSCVKKDSEQKSSESRYVEAKQAVTKNSRSESNVGKTKISERGLKKESDTPSTKERRDLDFRSSTVKTQDSKLRVSGYSKPSHRVGKASVSKRHEKQRQELEDHVLEPWWVRTSLADAVEVEVLDTLNESKHNRESSSRRPNPRNNEDYSAMEKANRLHTGETVRHYSPLRITRRNPTDTRQTRMRQDEKLSCSWKTTKRTKEVESSRKFTKTKYREDQDVTSECDTEPYEKNLDSVYEPTHKSSKRAKYDWERKWTRSIIDEEELKYPRLESRRHRRRNKDERKTRKRSRHRTDYERDELKHRHRKKGKHRSRHRSASSKKQNHHHRHHSDKHRHHHGKRTRRHRRKTYRPTLVTEEAMVTCSYIQEDCIVNRCPLGHFLDPTRATWYLSSGCIKAYCTSCSLNVYMYRKSKPR